MEKFIKEHWSKIIPIIISCFALFFSGWSFINQLNFKRTYNETARQVMINAEKIELFNLDEIYNVVANSSNVPITYDGINAFLSDMKENYQIIANLETTNIPNKQIMTYQFLRMDMKADIDGFTTIFDQYKSKNNNPIKFGDNKSNILRGLNESRISVKRDMKSLEENRTLESNNLDQSDKNFESAYSGQLESK